MKLKTIKHNPGSCYWWFEVKETYDGDEGECIYSTSFIGGDFEDWCMIPYSEWKDIHFDSKTKYIFKLFFGSENGMMKEYTLKLKGKDQNNIAVYFDMEEEF